MKNNPRMSFYQSKVRIAASHWFAILLLLSLRFTPMAWGADIPRARVLEGELPGLDLEVVKILRQTVKEAGYESRLDIRRQPLRCRDIRGNTMQSPGHPNGRVLPTASIRVIEDYLNAGGQMIVCGLPLWEEGVAKVAGRWTTQHERGVLLAATQPRQLVINFAKEDLSKWRRSSNLERPPANYETTPAESGKTLHVLVPELNGWDTFGRDVTAPFAEMTH